MVGTGTNVRETFNALRRRKERPLTRANHPRRQHRRFTVLTKGNEHFDIYVFNASQRRHVELEIDAVIEQLDARRPRQIAGDSLVLQLFRCI